MTTLTDEFDLSDVREPPVKRQLAPESVDEILALAREVLEDFRWDTREATRIERLATWVRDNLGVSEPCGFEFEAKPEGVHSPQLGSLDREEARGMASALLRAAGPAR
jgi:hypothetical protein